MLIIDTNILLDFPQIIEEEQEEMVIATDVLKELDGLKMHNNFDVSYKARRAAVVISRHLDKLTWDNSLEKVKYDSVDDKLIELAKKRDATLVTNDVYMKVKAITNGVKTKAYGSTEAYNGVKTLLITPSNVHDYNMVLNISETGEVPDELKPVYENQYVVFKDLTISFTNKHNEEDYQIYKIFVCRGGKLSEIHPDYELRIKNEWCKDPAKGIGPRNPEQSCLFDILKNPDITIVYAGGKFGTGKSFVLNNFALQELEKGKIKKVVYVPNNSYTENTIDIGALPGELLDKVVGQIGPLVDLVGIDKVQDMIAHEQLEVVNMGSIRGRSFEDSIIIVNEAQNLTEDHVKLLIARTGEGSRIFFDGDLKQTDSAIFRNRNGLKLLLNLRKSPIYSKIFATVQLRLTERSLTAQASTFLDEFTGGI